MSRTGQVEAVHHELARDGRHQLVGPLVAVHPRVQAAGLLELGLALASRLQRVQRAGRRGEEPERVDVRTGDLVRLDDGVGTGPAQPQRPVVVAHARLVDVVQHRPLVEPEAAEGGRPVQGRREEPADRRDPYTPLGEVGVEVNGGHAPVGPVEPPRLAIGVDETHARTRVPAPQRGDRVRVVGEEKVLDRVADGRHSTGPVSDGGRVDPDDVFCLEPLPLVRSQDLHGYEGMRSGTLCRCVDVLLPPQPSSPSGWPDAPAPHPSRPDQRASS